MKEKIPEISFERSMNHNYIILSQCSYFEGEENECMDYRKKMLLENRIPGLLPVSNRRINGRCQYYYEINSLQPLDRVYDKSEIRYEALRKLLSGCVSLFDRLEEYLLDGEQIIIKPELIYIDVENMEPYFVCYPDYEGDVRLSFMEFIDELLTKIDHTDERAVMLGYQVYRYTRNPNYVISEIGKMMEHVIVDMLHRERESVQEDLCPTDRMRSGGEDSSRECVERNICDSDLKTFCDAQEDERSKSIGDLIGGIFCIFVSLCAGAIILGARMLHSFQLSGNNELYLCGAMGMAIVAAILFFSCYLKKRQQNQEIKTSNEDDDGDVEFYTSAGSGRNIYEYHDKCSVSAAGAQCVGNAYENALDRFDVGAFNDKIKEGVYESTLDSQDFGMRSDRNRGRGYDNTIGSQDIEMNSVKSKRSVCESAIENHDIRMFGGKSQESVYDNLTENRNAEMYGAKRQERAYDSVPDRRDIGMQRVYGAEKDSGFSQQNETIYLGGSIVEERMLCGRINGREVNISLDRLPMTVGKLANMADFVINDTAVSKMHARFEERDGRIYLCDLNSTNGTVCNGVLLGVNQSVALEPGDRLRFGRTCFTYC